VTVIDGATNGVIATVAAGAGPRALCYNPTNNKVYCANSSSDNVTVIDGATNGVIATVAADDRPRVLCYNPSNNKVYSANWGSDNVTVIDGATNGVITTIPVGREPIDFCHNPAQNRVYVADYDGSSISVLRDSMPGIEEGFGLQAASFRPAPTIVRGVLYLPEHTSSSPSTSCLLDVSGRKVLDLHTGANDVRALAPGVYFVRDGGRGAGDVGRTRKVVLQR
jgi:YVTN family beta-propeller protein